MSQMTSLEKAVKACPKLSVLVATAVVTAKNVHQKTYLRALY